MCGEEHQLTEKSAPKEQSADLSAFQGPYYPATLQDTNGQSQLDGQTSAITSDFPARRTVPKKRKLTERQQVFRGVDINHRSKMSEVLFLYLSKSMPEKHRISSLPGALQEHQ